MQAALSNANAAVSTAQVTNRKVPGSQVWRRKSPAERSATAETVKRGISIGCTWAEKSRDEKEGSMPYKKYKLHWIPRHQKMVFQQFLNAKSEEEKSVVFFCVFFFLMGCHFLGKTVESKLGGSFVSIPCAHWGRNGVYGKSKMEPINTFPRKFFKDWESINFLWKSKISIYILQRRKP